MTDETIRSIAEAQKSEHVSLRPNYLGYPCTHCKLLHPCPDLLRAEAIILILDQLRICTDENGENAFRPVPDPEPWETGDV